MNAAVPTTEFYVAWAVIGFVTTITLVITTTHYAQWWSPADKAGVTQWRRYFTAAAGLMSTTVFLSMPTATYGLDAVIDGAIQLPVNATTVFSLVVAAHILHFFASIAFALNTKMRARHNTETVAETITVETASDTEPTFTGLRSVPTER